MNTRLIALLGLATLLFSIGSGLIAYKVQSLGFSLLPSNQTPGWVIDARVEVRSNNMPVKVSLAIPGEMSNFIVIDEDFISSGFGLAVESNGGRRVVWAKRRVRGREVLYYRMQLAEVSRPLGSSETEITPPFPLVPRYAESTRQATLAFLDEVRGKSADIASFTQMLILRLNSSTPDGFARTLKKGLFSGEDWVQREMELLAGARIPSRLISVLKLRDGITETYLEPWLQVHDGSRWLTFNPRTGEEGLERDCLIWQIGDKPLVSVKQGVAENVVFSVAKTDLSLLQVAEQRATQLGSHLMEFSLFSLPVQAQNVYRVLLLMPLGAFVVVLMRNIIGVSTFGTFMPILIALAFRETELVWGLVMFTLVVFMGLMIRSVLESLQLLLVPRLTAVLIIVVILMLVISMVSYKLGLERGLSISLFPMVILTMTIERMSLIWEESGPVDALKKGLGSLLVAIVGYFVMTNPYADHLVYMFPEVLLILFSLTLLLGRYTGFRLTELWRFRSLLWKKAV